MKEPVRRTKHPKLAAVCVVAIAITYFYLLARNKFPEPGPNLLYEVEPFEQVDNIETDFEETLRIEVVAEKPSALAIAPGNRLFVAAKDTILVYDAQGALESQFAIEGTATCLALTPDGQVLAGIRDHIEVFTVTGEVQHVWPDLGPRAYLTSIDADDEQVFVADAGNRVVYRFDRAGNLQDRIGEADPDKDIPGIVAPSPYLDLALDADGALWVANAGQMGLESYRSDGDLITSWYKPTLKLEGFSGCCNPVHIAFTAEGRLVTCEKGLVRIKLYEVTAGEFEELVAGSRLFPEVEAPKDLAVDANGRILVLDPQVSAVRFFERRKQPEGNPA